MKASLLAAFMVLFITVGFAQSSAIAIGLSKATLQDATKQLLDLYSEQKAKEIAVDFQAELKEDQLRIENFKLQSDPEKTKLKIENGKICFNEISVTADIKVQLAEKKDPEANAVAHALTLNVCVSYTTTKGLAFVIGDVEGGSSPSVELSGKDKKEELKATLTGIDGAKWSDVDKSIDALITSAETQIKENIKVSIPLLQNYLNTGLKVSKNLLKKDTIFDFSPSGLSTTPSEQFIYQTNCLMSIVGQAELEGEALNTYIQTLGFRDISVPDVSEGVMITIDPRVMGPILKAYFSDPNVPSIIVDEKASTDPAKKYPIVTIKIGDSYSHDFDLEKYEQSADLKTYLESFKKSDKPEWTITFAEVPIVRVVNKEIHISAVIVLKGYSFNHNEVKKEINAEGIKLKVDVTSTLTGVANDNQLTAQLAPTLVKIEKTDNVGGLDEEAVATLIKEAQTLSSHLLAAMYLVEFPLPFQLPTGITVESPTLALTEGDDGFIQLTFGAKLDLKTAFGGQQRVLRRLVMM